MKKILITGGAGSVGGELTQKLAERGYQIEDTPSGARLKKADVK